MKRLRFAEWIVDRCAVERPTIRHLELCPASMNDRFRDSSYLHPSLQITSTTCQCALDASVTETSKASFRIARSPTPESRERGPWRYCLKYSRVDVTPRCEGQGGGLRWLIVQPTSSRIRDDGPVSLMRRVELDHPDEVANWTNGDSSLRVRPGKHPWRRELRDPVTGCVQEARTIGRRKNARSASIIAADAFDRTPSSVPGPHGYGDVQGVVSPVRRDRSCHF